ncbi:uncharacterized protein N7506_002188 [Penicillium brevicompactum]|uniref:uncharacterized protein n=1 Tax=Penicillium brevicompactum TaxID=5074 RepID=UPI00253FA7FD|nr:uncharacterized protein N7506_002188 [Penicillium brevicompactum]KAJ5348935.1 hypothetical protein N7506_002188 [Penicillium brevicompactum]
MWTSSGCGFSVFWALNHLLIKPKDGNDFIDANGRPKDFFSRLGDATRLVTSVRAINTPQQAKNTPSWPAYYAQKDGKKISRARVLTRALNHLLIKPKDGNDFIDANGRPKDFFSRLGDATRLVTSVRAIDTPQQAKNTPSWPAYYAQKDGKKISRARFLTREISIGLWQYLLLDVLTFMLMKDALERKESGKNIVFGTEWDFPAEQWVELVIMNLVAWLVAARTSISSLYRLSAIICVATGIWPVSDFPPLFNSMSDAYTLRNFWGKFWHQMLRLSFTGVSNFISRDVLRLAKPSLVERYINVFLVFFISGLMHLLANPVQSISLRQSGAMPYFLSFVIGYMIEDGVASLWKQIRGSRYTEDLSLWQKTIGFCWVFGWIGVSSTFYFGPQIGRPECAPFLVPFSILNSLGLPATSALLVVGGILLKLKFKIEI